MKSARIAVVFLLASLISIPVCQADDEFKLPAFGFSIRKPSSWHFAGKGELDKSKDLLDDKAIKELVKNSHGTIVSIMKYEPTKYAGVIPTVHVMALTPDQFPAKIPVEKLVEHAIEATAHFKDAAVAEAPSAVQLAGHAAGHVRVTYTLSFEGQSAALSTEVWYILHKDMLFTITAITRLDEKNGTRAEMREIIDTIKIE